MKIHSKSCSGILYTSLALLAIPLLALSGLAQQSQSLWKLECNTRIPLHDRSGQNIGTTLIPAGTLVERLPTTGSSSASSIRLVHMGETFDVPTGQELKSIIAKQNPPGTPEGKMVLDQEKWNLAIAIAHGKHTVKSTGNDGQPPVPAVFTTLDVPMEIPTESAKQVPADFAWDRTLIIPGKFGFLKLPFIKQTKPGICVAAAAINVVCHLHPDTHLLGSELFRIYNNRPNGA